MGCLEDFRERSDAFSAGLRRACESADAAKNAVVAIASSQRQMAMTVAAVDCLNIPVHEAPVDPPRVLLDYLYRSEPALNAYNFDSSLIGVRIVWNLIEKIGRELACMGLPIDEQKDTLRDALLRHGRRFAMMSRNNFNPINRQADVAGDCLASPSPFTYVMEEGQLAGIRLRQDVHQLATATVQMHQGMEGHDNRFHCPAFQALDAVIPYIIDVYFQWRETLSNARKP